LRDALEVEPQTVVPWEERPAGAGDREASTLQLDLGTGRGGWAVDCDEPVALARDEQDMCARVGACWLSAETEPV
jgi:hypothetical protein